MVYIKRILLTILLCTVLTGANASVEDLLRIARQEEPITQEQYTQCLSEFSSLSVEELDSVLFAFSDTLDQQVRNEPFRPVSRNSTCWSDIFFLKPTDKCRRSIIATLQTFIVMKTIDNELTPREAKVTRLFLSPPLVTDAGAKASVEDLLIIACQEEPITQEQYMLCLNEFQSLSLSELDRVLSVFGYNISKKTEPIPELPILYGTRVLRSGRMLYKGTLEYPTWSKVLSDKRFRSIITLLQQYIVMKTIDEDLTPQEASATRTCLSQLVTSS
jgi:hypothetical protein